MALVEVKPIEYQRWHGKKSEESFQKPFLLRALVDKNTSTYATGLSEAQEARLSKALRADLSNSFNPDAPHPFWDLNILGAVKLENKTNIFDSSKPHDEIKIAIMKASKFVANSVQDYEEGKYPYAKFVIYDKADEVSKKEKAYVIRKNLIKRLDAMVRVKKEEILRILMGNSYSEQSNDYIDMKIMECVDTFSLEEIQQILDRDERYNFVHALILEGLSKGVLRKEGQSVFYFSDRIGYNVGESIQFLLDDNNSTVLNNIISQTRPIDERNTKKALTEEERKKNIAIKK